MVTIEETRLNSFSIKIYTVFRNWGVDGGVSEELLDLVGLWCKLCWIVTVEEYAGSVVGVLELAEGLAALLGNLVGSTQCCVQNCGEVSIGKVQAFFRAVVDVLAAQIGRASCRELESR